MLVSEALRPANTTQDWALRLNAPDIAAQIERAMADIAVIEAATSQQEALAIAVAMRGALHDRQRATLVTPDRLLARRGKRARALEHRG